MRPHRQQPTRLPCPWDSWGKNPTGVGCHFLLQCMKVKSESEVAHSCLTLSDPMDYSPPGSSVHGIFQARVLEWGAIAFSVDLILAFTYCLSELLSGSAGKESAHNEGDLGSIPGLGRSPGEGNGYPLRHSGLENSIDCIVYGFTKSRTWLSDFYFLTPTVNTPDFYHMPSIYLLFTPA